MRQITLPLLFSLLLAAVQATRAQTTADTAQGETPYAVYQAGDVDNVNIVNGNVYVKIPLLSYSQRGHDLTMNFYIYVNNKQWSIQNFQLVTPYNGTGGYTGYWGGPAATQGEIYWPLAGAYVARDQDLAVGVDAIGNSWAGGGSNATQYVVNTTLDGFYAITGDGSKHYIGDSETQSCSAQGGGSCPTVYSGYGAIYPATDGTNYKPISIGIGTGCPWGCSSSSEVVTSSGVDYKTTYTGTGASQTVQTTETDRNSNSITMANNGWTDTIGRSIPGSFTGPGTVPGMYPTQSGGAINSGPEPIPGIPLAQNNIGNCPAGTAAAREWVVPAHDGETSTYYLCYSYFSYQTAFDVDSVLNTTLYSGVSEVSSTGSQMQPDLLLSAIVLPNGTSYGFSYDQYLCLTNLTLPTGGSINYTWETVGLGSLGTPAPVSRAVNTRTVQPGQGQPAGTWTYHYYLGSNGSAGWNVVTDPQGNDVEHQITAGAVPYGGLSDTGDYYYQGCGPHDTAASRTCSPSTGTLLKSVAYTLSAGGSGGANSGTPGAVGYGLSNQVTIPTTLTTTLYGSGSNAVSQVVKQLVPQFGSCQLYSGFGEEPTPPNSTAPQYFTFNQCYSTNQIQSTAYYDNGTSSPGPLLKTVTTNYLWQATPAYFTANLLDLAASVVTTDGSGNKAAEADYGYDENNGSPQGAFGNQTSVSRWNNGGTADNSGNAPKTQTVYNSQGMPTLLTDANGNQTDIQTYQCSGAFPQQVVTPYQSTTTSAETTAYVYDCNIGKPTSVTDANSQQTTYAYNDSLNRLTSITSPDVYPGTSTHAATSYQYEDTASPVNVTVSELITPSATKQTEYEVDGLGRLIHSMVQSNSPASTIITTDTTYDSIGRVASVSNPYFSTSDATYGVTSYGYDPLSRMTSKTNPDRSAVSWAYTGAVVTFEDEVGNHWQRTSDGIGRLVKVLEPNGSSSTPSMETDYSYDALDDLLAVTQEGVTGTDTSRSRSFTYDSLSRLLAALNPESGSIGYSYDANGNVLTRTDARSVATSFVYDALNRLTSKSFSTSDTSHEPWSCYQYDASTAAGSGANLIGRLTNEWTQSYAKTGGCAATPGSSGNLTLRSILAYDPTGRITSEQECAPAGCASGSSYVLNYEYDLAGNLIYSNNGIESTPGTSAPLSFTSLYDGLGRLQTVTSSAWTNTASHPTCLFAAQSSASVACSQTFTTPYAAFGGLTNAAYGNGLTLSRTYDDRLRVTGEADTGGAILNATSGAATVTILGAEQSH